MRSEIFKSLNLNEKVLELNLKLLLKFQDMTGEFMKLEFHILEELTRKGKK
jgi:hypothetical protein